MKIFLFMAMLGWGGAAAAQTAQVIDTANVNMRSGKAENYRIIRVLPPRAELEVIKIDQDYVEVKAADGQIGWVLRKFLDIHKVEAKNVSSIQADLEAAQKELVTARVELANLQREVEKKQNQPDESAPKSFLLLLALGAFACGVAIGVLILRAYYHKRLHGLRI